MPGAVSMACAWAMDMAGQVFAAVAASLISVSLQ
jgi:hypothetical protein